MTSLFDKICGEIRPINAEQQVQAKKRLDGLVKPIGSLGRLEDMIVQIAGITGGIPEKMARKCIVIMAADNGVCAEGVSSAPTAVTAMQTINFTRGITGVNVFSRQAGADIRIVDIGVDADLLAYPGIIDRKVARGTGNIAAGPAMTRSDAIRGIETGIEMVQSLVSEGYSLIGTGERGIGNTTSSSAMLMAFTGLNVEEVVGRGAGLTDEAYVHKKEIIHKAVAINKPNAADPLDVLCKVGGLDIAGLTGCFLAGAALRVPVVIDGFISAVAALCAYRIHPLVKDYLIPSHCSAEPGYLKVMQQLNMAPMLNLGMRLGEGSGCALQFMLIDAAIKMVNEMGTFEQAGIDDDFLQV